MDRDSLRLAFCANVFPGETPEEVFEAVRGPGADLASRRGGALGYGLYLAAEAAHFFAQNSQQCEALKEHCKSSGLEVWTANAFPYGGFHGASVKEKAFLPDWSDPRRVRFTLDVARTLAHLAPQEDLITISTCPLGYGRNEALEKSAALHLREVQDGILEIERDWGGRIVLGLEPEPDGGFETVADACSWVAAEIPDPGDGLRVGICWDLCHGAVVGENAAVALQALQNTCVPLAKVQISSALRIRGPLMGEDLLSLELLASDPWFHQVRGGLEGEGERAWPDLKLFLDDIPVGSRVDARIHCHVPLTGPALGEGLTRTPWEDDLKLAVQSGCFDFEVETYTLPFLPDSWKHSAGLLGTLAEEIEAASRCLELDSTCHGN